MNLFKTDPQQFFENKCLQAEQAAHLNQSSNVYFVIRNILGKSTTNPPTDNDELIKEWAAYFKELLNVRNEEGLTEIPPAATDLDICTDNFSLDEL